MSKFDRFKYNKIDMEKTFGVLEVIIIRLPDNKRELILNAKTYGRRVKRWPMQSKRTITEHELKNYTLDLMNIYKQWGDRPEFSELNKWSIKEGEGTRFTVILRRKEV